VGTPVLYQGVLCADNNQIRWDTLPCATRPSLSTIFDTYTYTYFGYCGYYPTAAPKTPVVISASGLGFSAGCPYSATLAVAPTHPVNFSTQCIEATAVVVFDAVSVILATVSIRLPQNVITAAAQTIAQDLTKVLQPADVSKFEILASNLKTATSVTSQGTAILAIAKKIGSLLQPNQIYTAVTSQLSWEQELEDGATLVAQLGALFLTGGAAELADAVLVGIAIDHLVNAAIALSTAC
jgi:hypothetical protein